MAVDNSLFFGICGGLVFLFYILILRLDIPIFKLENLFNLVLTAAGLYAALLGYNSIKENLDIYQRGIADGLALMIILLIFFRAFDRKASQFAEDLNKRFPPKPSLK